MTTTAYFRENVLLKRPYLNEAMCRAVLANPHRREVQADGRIRFWAFEPALGKWSRWMME